MNIVRRCPPRTVTYIALGPLTNLAQVLREDGKCFGERINRVVIMGGTLDAPGNVTPVAECVFHVYRLLINVALKYTHNS